MKKVDPVFFILLIYIALLVNADEKEIPSNVQDTIKDKTDSKIDPIDNDPKEDQSTSSIDNNSNENQDSDFKDKNVKENQDNDFVDNNSDENENIKSKDDNSKEEVDTLNENQNIDNIDESLRKGIINSEKATVDSLDDTFNSEEVNDSELFDSGKKGDDEEENIIEFEEKEDSVESDDTPIEISQVKVIRDNVTGHKRSSFSEDKSENRGDESNVSQLKEDAENRILEKEKEREMHEGEDDNNKEDMQDNIDGPVPPEVLNTDNVDGTEKINTDTVGENADESIGNSAVKDENTGNSVTKDDEVGKENVGSPSNVNTKEDVQETNNIKEEEKKIELGNEGEEEIPNSFLGQDDEFDSPFSDKSSKKDENEVDKEKMNVGDDKDSQKDKKTQPAEEKIKSGGDESKEKDESSQKDDNAKSSKKKKEPKIQPGAKYYDEAMDILNKKDINKSLKLLAYKLLTEAADMNNTDAAEKIAYPYMFGDFVKRNKTKAVELFHNLAEKGNPLGQQGLGIIYGAGLNVNSSQAKALIYTTFAALGGNAMASMMLGYRYFNGIGVAKSCESALTHYKKVAKKVTDETTSHGGNAVQRIRLYDELEQPGGTSGQIDEDLLQYYQFLADKGDLQAQVGLGQLYFQGGRGIDVNYEKAFKYFQLAGDVDNGNGLAYLGKMYLDGLHVEKDQKKAFEYFTKAAEQSNPIGQAGLGMIYLKGAGVKKDYDQAMKYFSQAAEQGWMEGQLQLGNMYYNGIGVKKDYRQAVKYFTFASQSGHVMAFYNLASMHATGAGVMRSCNTATELFKNVAERGKWSMMFMDAYDSYRAGDLETALLKYYYLAELGYEVAQSNVAYVLEKGELSWFSPNQTFARALLQWSRAAHQGYAVARVKVGDYHFYGHGTKVDYDAAALHYRMASDQQNNPQAMFNLGYMHEQGFGLKEDIHLAKRFYDMAAEASPDAHFPVTLALMKLTLFFTWEWVKKNYRFWEAAPFERWWIYILQKLGPDWDMYLITALAVMLGGLLLFRRTLRR